MNVSFNTALSNNDSYPVPYTGVMATSPVPLGSTVISCQYFGGDEHKCVVIYAVKRTTASISLLGCLFIIGIIWLFRKYTVFTQRLILYMTIASFFVSISYIMGDQHPKGGLCSFEAWMMTFCDWVLLFWICCFTFNLYQTAVRFNHTEKYEWVYHVVSWGVPFFISFLPFIDDKYGPSGLWCWIERDWVWRFCMWYFPFFTILICLVPIYLCIAFKVRKKLKTWEGHCDPNAERNKKILHDEVRPLAVYPIIYLCAHIFSLINRAQQAVSEHPVFALVLLHGLTKGLTGAINALYFGLTSETRSRLTPSQIKMAFLSYRYREKALIRDYPVAPTEDYPDYPQFPTTPQEETVEIPAPQGGDSSV